MLADKTTKELVAFIEEYAEISEEDAEPQVPQQNSFVEITATTTLHHFFSPISSTSINSSIYPVSLKEMNQTTLPKDFINFKSSRSKGIIKGLKSIGKGIVKAGKAIASTVGGMIGQKAIWGKQEHALSVNDAIPREFRYIQDRGQILMNEQERQQWVIMYDRVYKKFWQHCRERVPMNYMNYCKQALLSYPLLMQGLHWGDKPEIICVRYDFCSTSSYVAKQPHFRTTSTQPKQKSFLAKLLT